METGKDSPAAAVEQAQLMYRAVLAPWAMDLMSLRRRGLDRPGRRYAHGLVLRPASPPGAGVVGVERRRAA